MLGPWPESLWAYRRIWDRVSEAARVVAIDLPGFGHSDGRPELIAPDAMGTFLARLIEECGLDAPHARTTWCRGPTTSTSPTCCPTARSTHWMPGHFAWEQASDEYGRLIVEWVTGGFQRLGDAVTA
jgi:hypothetical protein